MWTNWSSIPLTTHPPAQYPIVYNKQHLWVKANGMVSGIQMTPSDVSELMPRPLDLSMETNRYGISKWTFWSSRPNDELNYQCKKMAAPVPSYTWIDRDTIKSIFERIPFFYYFIIQFWSPVKVNGLTFLSTADQPFALTYELDKRLCSYRKLCLDTLIPIDIINGESLLGPPGRVFISGFPECSGDIRSYSAVEFPLLQHAIQLGIRTYYAVPVFKLHENHCLGVFEIASTESDLYFERCLKALDLGSYGLYSPCWPTKILSKLSQPWNDALDQIKAGLYMVRKRHSLPFAQIWIPDSQFSSIKALIATNTSVYGTPRTKYSDFSKDSKRCYIQRGRAVVGRAFSSQGSCFCRDVKLLTLTEYPLVPTARKAKLTQCFAICLRSKCTNNFVCVVECFLPPNEMVGRDAETFLNKLLSTMKEKLPGVTVASGQELGQRMVVEEVKISPSDELDSFEIGQPLSGVQSLQDGGETTEIDSLSQQTNLQHVENNVTTEQLVPCSSHRPVSFNCERPLQVATPTLVPHPTEEAVTFNVDVVHDDHIEFEKDRGEMIHPDSYFEQPNVEFDITGNVRSKDKGKHNDTARYGRKLVEAEDINRESQFFSGAATKVQKNDSQKNDIIQRLVKDYEITREFLEQFGMAREELNSFEIGQPLPSVQSIQGGVGEIIKINSSLQQSNLRNVENNVSTAPVVPSCSSHRLDSFNCEGPAQVDLLLQHPTEKAAVNRRRVDVDVAHDHIEIEKDMSEIMQPDCHFEQPNLEIDSTGNARSNDRVEHSDIAPPRPTNLQKIHSQKDTIQRIVKDRGVTREILEQHFGMERKDAAKTLKVSVSTLKRICREHDISRWPHYKTRKVNHHASKGVAVQGVEPYVRDQERPDLSQEKGTDYLVHKPSPATGKACDSVMTVKVTYKDDIIKFKLTTSSTRIELQEEVEKRLNISLEKFSIKYQDEDDDWVTITGDSDLREGMSELRLLGKTTMKLLVTPKSDT